MAGSFEACHGLERGAPCRYHHLLQPFRTPSWRRLSVRPGQGPASAGRSFTLEADGGHAAAVLAALERHLRHLLGVGGGHLLELRAGHVNVRVAMRCGEAVLACPLAKGLAGLLLRIG